MRTLGTAEKSRMISAVEEAFNDVCDIHVPTAFSDSFGQGKKSFETVGDVACNFALSNPDKTARGQLVTEDCDAVLRLPLATEFYSKYEVTAGGFRFKVKGVAQSRSAKIITLVRMDGNG